MVHTGKQVYNVVPIGTQSVLIAWEINYDKLLRDIMSKHIVVP